MMVINKTQVFFAVILLCVSQLALSNEQSTHSSMDGVTLNLTCNLINQTDQCREYTVLKGASNTLDAVKDGCVSMEGSLGTSGCPDAGLIAQCVDIVRNYKKPDAIYDAYYYSGKKISLLPEDIHRVCKDLGGEYLNLAN